MRTSTALRPSRTAERVAFSLRSGWRLLARLGLVLSIAALAACAGTRGGPVPYDVKNFGAPDLPVAIASTSDYHLGPSDVLSVTVFGVSEFSGDYTVDSLGRIKLPLVGDVAVLGQTSDQVAVALKTKLQATYLRNPEVQVVLKTALSQRITVDGSVTQPGVYPLAGDTSLLQSLAMAKGVTVDANPRRVVIFRTLNGQRTAAAFDLKDIRRGKQPDPRVFGNDIIVVDGNSASATFKNFISTVPLLTLFRPF
jgi:polysaccharide export outer membrane protein